MSDLFTKAFAAYHRAIDLLRFRKRAYEMIFKSAGGEVVLADLGKFCRGRETTYHPDSHVQAMLEGRRQVLLRIEQHLSYSSEELAILYKAPPMPINITGDDDGE